MESRFLRLADLVAQRMPWALEELEADVRSVTFAPGVTALVHTVHCAVLFSQFAVRCPVFVFYMCDMCFDFLPRAVCFHF